MTSPGLTQANEVRHPIPERKEEANLTSIETSEAYVSSYASWVDDEILHLAPQLLLDVQILPKLFDLASQPQLAECTSR